MFRNVHVNELLKISFKIGTLKLNNSIGLSVKIFEIFKDKNVIQEIQLNSVLAISTNILIRSVDTGCIFSEVIYCDRGVHFPNRIITINCLVGFAPW